MNREFPRVAWRILLLVVIVGVILFSEYAVSSAGPSWLRSIAQEIRAVCRDPGTQWMVFACCAIYFITFTLLENRAPRNAVCGTGNSTTKHTKGGAAETLFQRFSISDFQSLLSSPDLWLFGLLLLAALPYALNYATASSSTQALMLIAGAAIGKGARLWAEWGNAERGAGSAESITTKHTNDTNHATENLQPSTLENVKPETRNLKLESRNPVQPAPPEALQPATFNLQPATPENLQPATPENLQPATPENLQPATPENLQPSTCNLQLLLVVLLLLLSVAALWHPEGAMQFQYRGLSRWSGPWNNPNIFGLLMGVGVVLACGLLFSICKFQVAGCSPPGLPLRLVRGEGRGEVSPPYCRVRLWSVVPWSRGLVMVGLSACLSCCALGLLKSYSRGAWLGTALGLTALLAQLIILRPRSRPSSSISSPLSCVSCISWLTKNWRPLSVLLFSVLVIAFWQFRHTEFHPVRRAFSVGNKNDFSWRNRVAAWEGALAMIADKPLTGFGWNKPERIYDQFYRPSKVSEGMAIQLNHYFILGMSLGLPALLCFGAYIGLSLKRHVAQASLPAGGGSIPAPSSAPENLKPETRNLQPATTETLQPATSANLQPATCNLQLKAVCHSAAIVLLVGLWFDGGLFTLATGALFWTLLEVGRVTPCAPLQSRNP